MAEQQTFLTRIGSWFRKSTPMDVELGNGHHEDDGSGQGLSGPIDSRTTFLRPWGKRDQAIENLQSGVVALSNLMNSIRDNLEKQSQRQDELMQILSHLPQVLQSLPETTRLQAETLEAIQQQMEGQSSQQSRIAEVLDRISEASTDHGKKLEEMHEHVESNNIHGAKISDSLHNVGSAMETVSQTSQASTQVLQQLRDNLSARDGELERILQRQGTRFMTLLTVAIFLSVSALIAVGVLGYLAYDALQGLKH